LPCSWAFCPRIGFKGMLKPCPNLILWCVLFFLVDVVSLSRIHLVKHSTSFSLHQLDAGNRRPQATPRSRILRLKGGSDGAAKGGEKGENAFADPDSKKKNMSMRTAAVNMAHANRTQGCMRCKVWRISHNVARFAPNQCICTDRFHSFP
jgi:hypothetical protein